MKVVISKLDDGLRWTIGELADQLDFEFVAEGGYEIVAEAVETPVEEPAAPVAPVEAADSAAEATPAPAGTEEAVTGETEAGEALTAEEDSPAADGTVEPAAPAAEEVPAVETSAPAAPAAPAKKKYTLSVRQEGNKLIVTYPAEKPNLFYRGLRLLKQNENGKRGITPVTETYEFSELGVMLDCSRNAVRTVEHLKNVIRHLALMGYDGLRLYTEETYEIEGEPLFGHARGRYTKAELKEIDGYAAKFGIEVVPCIQTLAHLNQMFRWPQYHGINDINDILLIGEEKTYELIEKMFATCAECFRSRKIHIGMDEAHAVGRGKYEDRHGAVENRSELLLSHLKRVVALAVKYGFKPMMWSDLFFSLAAGEDGWYYSEKAVITDEVIAKVPPEVRLTYWDYYNDRKVLDRMFEQHGRFDNEYEFAGGVWTWVGYAPLNRFALNRTEAALDSAREHGCDKILLTAWGDDGGECSDFAALPTFVMAAERAFGHDDYAAAFEALTDVPLDTFMKVDLCNEVDKYDGMRQINPSKYMLFSDTLGGLFDALIKSGEGEVYDGYAKALKAAEKTTGRYSYIFAVQRALAEVLYLKYELGCKVTLTYKSGDRKALKALVKSNFEPLVKKLENLYEAVRERWDRENKPQGFEVQDYRLGGLIKRIEHCAERVSAYADGKLADLPELIEVDPAPFGQKRSVIFQKFIETFTASKM